MARQSNSGMEQMQLAMFLQQQAQVQSAQQNAQELQQQVIQSNVSSDTAQLIRQFSLAAGPQGVTVPFTGYTQGMPGKATA